MSTMSQDEVNVGLRFLWSGKALCRHCCLGVEEHRAGSQCSEFGYRFEPFVPLEQWPPEARAIAATELQRLEAAE